MTAEATKASHTRRTFKSAPLSRELTPREKDIVVMIADGYTTKQIAMILNLSTKTVECHRTAAMRKTSCTGVALLVRYAVRNGLIEP